MSLKIVIFLGLIAVVFGSATSRHHLPKTHPKPTIPSTTTPHVEVEWIEHRRIPSRKIRSPDGVNVNVSHNDKSGTSATVNANKNVWNSSDKKASVDVSGSFTKNLDHGNTNANAGVKISGPSEAAGININHNDRSGTSGSLNVEKNIWSRPDHKTNVDISGGVSKNFDHGNSDKNIALTVTHDFGNK